MLHLALEGTKNETKREETRKQRPMNFEKKKTKPNAREEKLVGERTEKQQSRKQNMKCKKKREGVEENSVRT